MLQLELNSKKDLKLFYKKLLKAPLPTGRQAPPLLKAIPSYATG